MKNAIQKIVEKIPSGKIFDSHYVINRLIRNYSDEYLVFASRITGSARKTAKVHGLIAQEIKKLTSVKQETGEFWSENIRGNASECAGWKKK